MQELKLLNPDGTPSPKVVQIDDAYFPHLIGYRWLVNEWDVVYRTEPRGKFGQRTKMILLSHVITGATDKQTVKHLDGNRLNSRQSNLEVHTLETLMKLLQNRD